MVVRLRFVVSRFQSFPLSGTMIILGCIAGTTIFHQGRSMPGSPVELALTRWRNNLIDLSRRNPLLALRATRSAYLEIQQPATAALFNAFVLHEKAWTFHLPPQAV